MRELVVSGLTGIRGLPGKSDRTKTNPLLASAGFSENVASSPE
jgi:hypothetical protein